MFESSGYSTNGLLMMYNATRQALEVDDNIPSGEKKIYGVREYADWKLQSDSFEKELDKRKIKYSKISW